MTAIRTLLLVAMLMVATSCGGKEGKIRSEFVAGCSSQGAPKAACKCLYDKLQDNYGLDVMAKMQEENEVPPDFGDVMVSSAAQCQRI